MKPSNVSIEASLLTVELTRRRNLVERLTRKPARESKTILDDISLSITGPSLTAIIGPSGSGKTTLLNTLSHRLSHQGNNLHKTSGTISISHNGNDLDRIEQIAYVQQSDILSPNLTVRETLSYAAAFSSAAPSNVRKERVEKIIESLRLGHCANTYIGDKSHKGCSGGEIRRCSIGVQILRDQPIIFLDEPTSGLDPKAAGDVVQVLRDLVDHEGKTVVVTLHQPRSEIWEKMENLVVMSQGAMLFAGATNDTLSHFAAAGWKAPKWENPFDFVSDLIAVDTRSEKAEEESRERVQVLRRLWKEHAGQSSQPTSPISTRCQRNSTDSGRHGSKFVRQLRSHCHRTLVVTLRDRLGITAILLEALTMGLACGLIFYYLDTDLTGIRSRQGALYCTSSMQSYLILLYEIYRLTVDIPAFDRERADGFVTPLTFYLSRRLTRFWIEDVPVPMVFSLAFYFLSGMRSGAGHFFSYFLVQFLLHLGSVNLAIICVVPTREIMIAGLLANLNYVVQCLCAGLFINAQSMGPWVGWVKWITQLHYGFGAMSSNELAGRLFDCPFPGGAANPQCREYTGDFIMASLGLPRHWLAVPVSALCGFVALFAVTAIAVLHWQPAPASRTPEVKETDDLLGDSKPLPLEGRGVRVSLDQLCVRIDRVDALGRKVNGSVIGPVSAEFERGTLNTVLGPSGSGKTTLLSAIASRLHKGVKSRHSMTGSVRFNGQTLHNQAVASVCSLVPQNDSDLLHHLTVRETLHFAAELRLPPSLDKTEKIQRAEAVLLELGLKSCADTVVGNASVRGISGGEKRRLSIAVRILANPSVLLLDEPTSGLDAFTASTIIEALRRLADEGRTVIMVLHQPRWSFMQACEQLLIMSSNRERAFLGGPDELIDHLPETRKVTTRSAVNPADLALDLLADGIDLSHGTIQDEEQKSSSELYSDDDESSTSSKILVPRKKARLRFARLLPILVNRSIKNLRRAPVLLFGRLAQIAGTGIIVVIFFTPLGYDYPSTQTRIGIIGQSSALFFVGMLNVLALYPAELDLFLSESQDGVSSAEAFFASYTLIELPIEIASALLLSLLMTFATQLSTRVDVFLVIAYTSFAIVNCGESLGMIVLTFIRHPGLAVSIMSIILALCTALNGAFSLHMLSWIQALNSLSPAKWQVQASASMSLRGVEFSCTEADRLANGRCPVETGDDLLQLYNLDVSTTRASCILAGVTVGYRIVAYFALKVRAWVRD